MENTSNVNPVASLKPGDIFYRADNPYKRFEIFKETNNVFYLAHCDGICSQIDFIPKGISLDQFSKQWFKTPGDVLENEANVLRLKLESVNEWIALSKADKSVSH